MFSFYPVDPAGSGVDPVKVLRPVHEEL